MTIIESVRTFLSTCPLLSGGVLNIDFLPEEAASYSVDVVPVAPVIKQYVDGSSVRRFAFVLSTRATYGEYARQQIDNLAFFDQLSDWLYLQNRLKNFPVLDTGLQAQKLEVTTSGYILQANTETARYQIQCCLTYFQKGAR